MIARNAFLALRRTLLGKDGLILDVECRWVAEFESGSLYSISRTVRTREASDAAPRGTSLLRTASTHDGDGKLAPVQTVDADDVARQMSALQSPTESPIAALTDRQRVILQLVCDGVPSKSIAKKLDVSVRTIDTERGKILKVFDAKNFVQLVTAAAHFLS